MSENLHDIDQLFRDGIEGHEDMPSEKVWDAVDAGLDKSNVVHIKRKYNNLKRIAAILLLLLLSVVAYEILKPKSAEENIARGKDSQGMQTMPGSEKTTTPGNTPVTDKAANNTTASNTVVENSGQSANAANAGMDTVSAADAAATGKAKPMVPPTVNSNVTDDGRTGAVNDGQSVQTGNRNKKQKNSLLPVNKKEEDVYGSSNADNRSAKGKTRLKVKNPVPQQYSEDGGNDTDETASAATSNTAVVTNLAPVENTKPATLAERINKAVDAKEQVAANRQSPDVIIKKMKSNRSFHFSVMPYFAPQFTSNAFKEEHKSSGQNTGPGGPPPPRPGRDNHKEQYKNDEQTQTAYTAGVLAEIPLGKKWSIQSGINYTQKNISIEPKKIYARPDKDGKVKYVFDCSSGYSYLSTKTGTTPVAGDSINVTSSKNTLGYIGVPVAVNYKFSLGRFSIMPTVGTVLNFLTKQKIETELVQGSVKEQQTISKIEGLKSSYLNATAGVAFEYDVNKRIALNIMPAGSFALTSINKDAGVKSYPNAFGVAGGIKINF